MNAAAVQPIPAGYESVIPYLIVRDAPAALAFYAKALGAVEVLRMPDDKGRIGHAEMRVGKSGMIMLAEEMEGHPGPQTVGGCPITLLFYVDDVDAVYARAVAAGARSTREPATQFYGDRSAGITDPFGYTWWLSTHVEDVPPDELARRAAAQGQG
ncbi:MAG: VOC family protein [Proteobacteria bacterium]|nr:VOC family protein [Pseudomonadota bacterium]